MNSNDRLVKRFMEMVRIDSPSYQEAEFKEYLYTHLQKRGLVVKEDASRAVTGSNSGNLIAFFPGKNINHPVIMLAVHMDTVEPGKGIEPQLKDGEIRSSGTTILGADDKAGVAVVMEVVDLLLASKDDHPPLELVFTIAEEQGLVGAKALDITMMKAELGYVLDSDGQAGEIVYKGPSQDQIEWTITGRAAHAGMCPEEGINAIQAAAQAIAGLRLGRIDEETTCNIGIINGGTARNIVPETCYVKGETRSLNEEKLQTLTEQMVTDFKRAVEAYGASCEAVVEHLYPAFELNSGEQVIKLAEQAATELGFTPRLVKSGGGCDANIFNGKGIPVANLGIGMKHPHTNSETIEVKDLEDATRWLYQIIIKAGGIA